MSRKRFVLFSAMTRRNTNSPFALSFTLLPSLLLCQFFSLSFLPMGFPVYLFFVLSLSCFLTFSRLLTFSVSTLGSLRGRLSPEAHRTDGKLWQSSCLWKRKTTLSHFLLFCLKLATGVAYLSRTEILKVARQGVSAITSSPIISFRLINAKSYHNSSIRVNHFTISVRHS